MRKVVGQLEVLTVLVADPLVRMPIGFHLEQIVEMCMVQVQMVLVQLHIQILAINSIII